HPLLRPAKIFQLHLLKLTRAESEIAWVDFIPERFPDLRDAEWQFLARHIENVFELNKDSLCCLRPKVRHARFIFARADVSSEHKIERPRRSQFCAIFWIKISTVRNILLRRV